MLNLEFIKYQETPSDKFMKGIITLRVDKKYIIRFKEVQGKDGKGTFFVSPNLTVEEYGEKKYLSSFQMDSRGDEEQLFDFIRKHVHEYTKQRTATEQGATYKHEVGVNDQLPF